MKFPIVIVGGVLAAGLAVFLFLQNRSDEPSAWNDTEIAILRSLSLASLPALPPDPSNAVADNPEAAEFGKQLFFDSRLSANSGISCATCHQPIRHFTDGLPLGQAIGRSMRNTRSIVGTAYSPWQYWDGRRDSQWAQALSPLEDPHEHGTNRIQLLRVIEADASYRGTYTGLFGPLPDLADKNRFADIAASVSSQEWTAAWSSMTAQDRTSVNVAFANIGKAIAAFERTLLPGASKFDKYVAAAASGDTALQEVLFSNDEVQGLRLFIGEAQCTRCHNGPLLSNNEFHNTGVLSAAGEAPDKGRASGVRAVLADPFNCRGEYSDDAEHRCAELDYVRTGPELVGTLRTPSLRNVELTAPYMHQGQIASIEAVLLHYNEAPAAMIGHNEAEPLGLNQRQLGQLAAFLRTLTGPPREDLLP